jgi:hypothetical protein
MAMNNVQKDDNCINVPPSQIIGQAMWKNRISQYIQAKSDVLLSILLLGVCGAVLLRFEGIYSLRFQDRNEEVG